MRYRTKEEYIRSAIDWLEQKIKWHADRENFPAHLITGYDSLLKLAYEGQERYLKEALKAYFNQPYYGMDSSGNLPVGKDLYVNVDVLIEAIKNHFDRTRKPLPTSAMKGADNDTV